MVGIEFYYFMCEDKKKQKKKNEKNWKAKKWIESNSKQNKTKAKKKPEEYNGFRGRFFSIKTEVYHAYKFVYLACLDLLSQSLRLYSKSILPININIYDFFFLIIIIIIII